MYEHLRMNEVLDKLEPEIIESLCQDWPEIKYAHYAARDIFRRMDVKTLSMLYNKGLEINCACLAVLTAEALIIFDQDYHYNGYSSRSDTSVVHHVVVKGLQKAFDNHSIAIGSNMVSVLGFTFLDKCQNDDYLLAKYGYELSRGLIFMGPEDWFKEAIKHSKRVPMVARDIPWANALLET